MNIARPIRSVIPSLQGEVLAVLAGTTQPLTGRTVARLVESGSPAGVARVLKALVHEGLVRSTAIGPASLYELNRDHVAADPILALSHLRETFLDRLREAIRSFPLTQAYVFGSAARGDGDSSSDIDVLLIHGDRAVFDEHWWDEQLAHLAESIRSWTGNPAGIVVYSETEFTISIARGDQLADDVLSHGIRLL